MPRGELNELVQAELEAAQVQAALAWGNAVADTDELDQAEREAEEEMAARSLEQVDTGPEGDDGEELHLGVGQHR